MEITMFASQLTSNYNEKKSHPTKSRSYPSSVNHHGTTLPKSLIKVYDTGLESRRASAFCQLCALKINAC